MKMVTSGSKKRRKCAQRGCKSKPMKNMQYCGTHKLECFICGGHHCGPHFPVMRQWKDVIVKAND